MSNNANGTQVSNIRPKCFIWREKIYHIIKSIAKHNMQRKTVFVILHLPLPFNDFIITVDLLPACVFNTICMTYLVQEVINGDRL